MTTLTEASSMNTMSESSSVRLGGPVPHPAPARGSSPVCTSHPLLRSASGSDTLERLDLSTRDATDAPWLTIVWNDPVNLQTYVSYVFRTYFGFTASRAERLMLQVHNDGRAVVASGGREQMERHVEAMHDYGLWATLTRDAP